MTEEFDLGAKLEEWYAIKAKIATLRIEENKERELRTEIFNHAFPNPVRTQNAKRIEFGMALVGKPKTSYSVDRAAITEMLKMPNLKPLIEDVVDFAPKVRDAAYEKLSLEDKVLLAGAFTVKPALPELELKSQGDVKKFTA